LRKITFGMTTPSSVKIKEGDKERVQVFQGDVISRRGGGTAETFTVRKVSAGIAVERVFPLQSPNVARIERVRAGQVRRKKLYYIIESSKAKKAKAKAKTAKPPEATPEPPAENASAE
jgi:large subunit ribosomal protein L19